MNAPSRYASWILQILVALVLLPSVYLKLAGGPETIEVFSRLGMEPNGRYLIAVLEAIAAVLLLFPLSAAWGAILGWGVMTGAIIAHLTKLGVADAMMPMTFLSLFNWFACAAILALRRSEIEFVKSMFSRDETDDAEEN